MDVLVADDIHALEEVDAILLDLLRVQILLSRTLHCLQGPEGFLERVQSLPGSLHPFALEFFCHSPDRQQSRECVSRRDRR